MAGPYQCDTCPKSYQTAEGLGQHTRRCPGRIHSAKTHLNKRKADLDDRAEEDRLKRSRLEGGQGEEEDEEEDKADMAEEVVEVVQEEDVRASPEVQAPTPPAPSPPGRRSRSGRQIRVPRRWDDYEPSYREELPSQLAEAFPPAPSPSPPPSESPEAVEEQGHAVDVFETSPDAFGVYHRYLDVPQRQPCAPTAKVVFDIPAPQDVADKPADYPTIKWMNRSIAHTAPASPYGPFESKTTYLLCEWFYNSANTKSLQDLDLLVQTLQTSGFKISDLSDFRARREMQRLDEYVSPAGIFSAEDGWVEGEVELSLPKPGVEFPSEADAPSFTVDGMYFRNLLAVIVGEVQDKRNADERHWLPHETFWVPPRSASQAGSPQPSECDSTSQGGPSSPSPDVPEPIRIWSETYNANRMNDEYAKLRSQPRHPSDSPSVEYVLLPLILWSDATLLALFGSAKLWPIYLYIANITKYLRGMPTEFLAQHLAYIPELPDELQDYYRSVYEAAPTAETLRWLKTELMQQVWMKLLDDDFCHAYVHGILVQCSDGVIRRLFPRIFTYSADYPEKVLLTALKNLGKCPCSRCLVKLKDISETTGPDDEGRQITRRHDTKTSRARLTRARKWLFTRGYSVTSKRIRDLLDAESLQPLRSAFSVRLGDIDPDFNAYDLLAPDLMHEFELGVWKGTFAHLMRLLHAQGSSVVQEFDRRMRLMPTFGRDTIRRFWNNVSRQNRLAARDFEDFLITSIPAFEGLLPLRDDQTVLDMVFELANWHALAKLRLHTTITIDIWRAATRYLYASVRRFSRTTCMRHVTRELPQETLARARRANAARKGLTGPSALRGRVVGPRIVKYNTPNTCKFHALSHHPSYVMRSGTNDNHDTRVGELEHRHAKRMYARTNKNAYEKQIATHQRRQAILRGIRADLDAGGAGTPNQPHRVPRPAQGAVRGRARHKHRVSKGRADSEHAEVDLKTRYDTGQSQREPVDLYEWLAANDDDPALQDFVLSLRRHLVARLTDTAEDTVPLSWIDSLDIKSDRLYAHKVIRFNYPTYDMRRAQDSVNPRTHADVMLLADDDPDGQPYWYARVIGVYHAVVRVTGDTAKASQCGSEWTRVDFLWVRWFAHDPDYLSGFEHRRLPRLTFVDAEDPDLAAFGFIDPATVIRAAYIIPSFVSGTMTNLLPSDSVARKQGDDEDFKYYYACLFVDRDMYMRHLGGGVGHRGIGVSLEDSRKHSTRIDRAESPPLASDDDDESVRSARLDVPVLGAHSPVDSDIASDAEEPKETGVEDEETFAWEDCEDLYDYADWIHGRAEWAGDGEGAHDSDVEEERARESDVEEERARESDGEEERARESDGEERARADSSDVDEHSDGYEDPTQWYSRL